MANLQICKTFPVGGVALSQYALVITPAALVVSTGSTVEAIGVVQNGYDASAAEAEICVFGVTRAIASEAISKGDNLQPAAAGKVAVHDGNATDVHIGVALEAATADGDEIEILLYANKTNAQA